MPRGKVFQWLDCGRSGKLVEHCSLQKCKSPGEMLHFCLGMDKANFCSGFMGTLKRDAYTHSSMLTVGT